LKYLLCLSLLILLIGCQPRLLQPQELPTAIPADLDAVATAITLTENAPPAGFREGISLPEIDQNTGTLSSWRAEIYLQFTGVFAGTSRETRATTRAVIQHNLLDSARRVVLTVEGEIFNQDEPLTTEGVRLGPDTFFVRDNTCATTTNSDASAIADLSASEIIGGVQRGVPDGSKAVINGEQVWRYSFTPDDLALTNVQLGVEGRLLDSAGELWFAPEHRAAIRFYLTLDVENATIFGSQVPVTGQAIVQYDLFEIGTAQNISVPYGC
jgi:hypothetical protein